MSLIIAKGVNDKKLSMEMQSSVGVMFCKCEESLSMDAMERISSIRPEYDSHFKHTRNKKASTQQVLREHPFDLML